MSILKTVVFQFKCLFFGIGIDVENIADEHASVPAVNGLSETSNIRPEVGLGSGPGSWTISQDRH
jgi:hypothetical protein